MEAAAGEYGERLGTTAAAGVTRAASHGIALRRVGFIVTFVILLLGVIGVASASALNVSGTWDTVYHCEHGWCAGQDFSSPGEVFVQAEGSNLVYTPKGEYIGTLTGNELPSQSGKPGEYQFTVVRIYAADGKSWSGPASDSNGTSGTDTGILISGGTDESAAKEAAARQAEHEALEARERAAQKHASAVSVSCYYDVLTSVDTCTAQVADASGSGVPPTGTVTFASSSPGAFLFGDRCTLVAAAVSSCAVAYRARDGSPSNVNATYSGDARYSGASAQTRLLGGDPSGETTEEIGKAPPGRYPDELDVSTVVPVDGTSVSVCVQQQRSSTAARAAEVGLGPAMEKIEAEFAKLDPEMSAKFKAILNGPIRMTWTRIKGWDAGRDLGSSVVKELNVDLNELESAEDALHRRIKELTEPIRGYPGAELKQLENVIDMLITEVREAEEAGCSGGGASVTALASKATGHPAPTRRHVIRLRKPVNLAYVHRPKVAAGPLRLRLHLNRRVLARAVAHKKSTTVAVRIIMVLPSARIPGGYPVAVIEHVTLKRGAKRRKH